MSEQFQSVSVPVQTLPSTITTDVFDTLLSVATECGASDIIFRSSTEVRARISGSLQRISDSEIEKEDIINFIQYCETEQTAIALTSGIPKSFAYTLITGKKRQRFRMSASSVNDKRTEYGVRLVCRPIQDRPLSLDSLDLPSDLKSILSTPINKGMILITGETGSGKTTLLASVIDEKAREDGIHIATLEDPIEFNLTYLNDHTSSIVSQASLGAHLSSFGVGLRGLLRDNPDVIMVGEMRDEETIKLGVEASRTGHLVYSTLHVTNVAAIVDRMCMAFKGGEQMQLAASLLDSLRCGVNQELLPKLCSNCAVPLEELPPILSTANISKGNAKQQSGCPKCNGTGFSGRTPIIEYLILTNDIRTALKTSLISDGLAGVSILLHKLVDELGQTKLKAAQDAFQSGLISCDQFVSIYMEYQTLEHLNSVTKSARK